MIHPSYVDLMQVVNKGVEEGETPVINSRYSIVMATAKRARQMRRSISLQRTSPKKRKRPSKRKPQRRWKLTAPKEMRLQNEDPFRIAGL